MKKSTAFRMSGFIGTAGVTVALVAAAVGGTGAYFTDSEAGNLSASSGHLILNVSNTHLSLTDLVPGTDKTANIDFNVDASGKSDVWLVFDTTTAAYGAFSGANGAAAYPAGGLGRYGHFAVSVNSGPALFQSYNLVTGPNGCYIDADGHGGSATQATSPTNNPPYCGVPAAIKLASGLTSGQGATANVTFGLTGKVTTQNTPFADVPFTIVATQAGVRPDALNF
ncbi:TasA family protein [Pengzhenrongella sicca]|uniref:Uncharacterized protein n=1 Tax=Pengzhenrongella sicca TaxID=2819238 RepID=A0A8A4ZJA9_9MICO|nr:TasA family protein [Pengzhenrongella sicca]QTE29688.1 hypothetical protein J4E96_01130 [Pengzhenrongella sicca]